MWGMNHLIINHHDVIHCSDSKACNTYTTERCKAETQGRIVPDAERRTARSSPLIRRSFLLLGASVVFLLQCIWSPCDEPVDSCALSEMAACLHRSSVLERGRQPACLPFLPVDCIPETRFSNCSTMHKYIVGSRTSRILQNAANYGVLHA